jgi:hypothetical protein
LLLLAACASEQWAKDSGEPATRQILSECTQQSMARASAEALSSGTYVGAQNVAGGSIGRTEMSRNQIPPPSTGIQEQTYFNLCMKEKGYNLVPAGLAAAR